MSSNNSLILFTQAAKMLAEADTIQKAKELKDLALTASDWARRKGMGEEAIRYAKSYALEAERKMGEMLLQTERAKGAAGNPGGRGATIVRSQSVTTQTPTLTDLGLTKRESSQAQFLANLPKESFEKIKSGEITIPTAVRETKRAEIVEKLESISAKESKVVSGVFDVIVIDPPWPIKKIDRDERPNQTELAYPTMTEDEILSLDIPAHDDCHVWIWTTHRFLPVTFELMKALDVKYVCTFVWHKPGGFQPIGLPQYNCEFVVYGRRGSPKFIDTKAFNACFNAGRGAHSEKPEEFYTTVRRVTAGRRLDMFGRRKIDGFESSGNEAL